MTRPSSRVTLPVPHSGTVATTQRDNPGLLPELLPSVASDPVRGFRTVRQSEPVTALTWDSSDCA